MSDTGSQDKRKGRGGRVLLIVSLAFNLFLVGLLAGAWGAGLRFMGPAMLQARGGMFGMSAMEMREIAERLPPDMRTEFRESMRAAFPDMRTALNEAIAARENVAEALSADPFDVETLKRRFEETRLADDKVRRLTTEAFTVFVAQLNADERELLIDAIEKSRRPFGRRDGGRFRSFGSEAEPMPGEAGSDASDAPE